MAFFWITLIVLIYLWEKVNADRKEILFLETEYRVYALRDRLRQLAIEGKADKDSRMFRYLDGSLTKSVGQMRNLGIFNAIALIFVHRKDEKLARSIEQFTQELEKPENKELKDIYYEVLFAYASYFYKRHKFSFWSTILPIAMYKYLENRISAFVNKIFQLPETSTLTKFA